MASLIEHCAQELAGLEQGQLQRQLRGPVPVLISFADNDYLGLARDARVIAAGQAALAEFGAGATASRLVAGNHPLYAPLEEKLAAMKGCEAALVFGSGYLANSGALAALVGEGDVIFADKLIHACLIDGAKLSGAKLIRFAHNDMAHLAALLVKHRTEYGHALIVTEHVFSMDGDVAPLAEIAALAQQFDTWTLVDDAHGLGVVKPQTASIDVWTGTLSKAAGGYGGYVAAKREVIGWLVNAARSLVFSTGLPPAICASALAALEIMEAEPQHGIRALANAQRVTQALGLPPSQSAIVPLILGENARALAAAEALRARGLLVVAIRPPTVPPGTARLRLAFSSSHTDAQVDQLIAALKEIM